MGTHEPMVEFAAVSIISAAQAVLQNFRKHPKLGPLLEEKGKRGGFLTVAEAGFGIYTTTLIGAHPAAKPSTFRVSGMKAQYLLQYPEHVMSRQGRDPDNELWGGGLHIPDSPLILAFSGLPEHVDELYVMALAAKLNLLTRPQAVALLEQFPNDYAKLENGDLIYL